MVYIDRVVHKHGLYRGWSTNMVYIDRVVHKHGLYRQGGPQTWFISTGWSTNMVYIDRVVHKHGLYRQGGPQTIRLFTIVILFYFLELLVPSS